LASSTPLRPTAGYSKVIAEQLDRYGEQQVRKILA
jgi:hypothetical protein